jgi:hypothetical protein
MSLTVSIHQPSFFPWAGLLDRIAKSDVHIFLDNVQFEKGSFVNRNKFAGQGREPFFLTVPVPSDCKKMNIGEIPVKQGVWVEKHLKTIQQLYDWRNDVRLDTIQHLYQDAYSLGVFNMQTTRFLLQHFKIDTPCIKASLLGCDKRKSELVLQLCQGCRATRYLSGPLGRDYLDLTSFADAGIEVVFNDYIPQTAHHKLSGLHLLKTVGEL